MSFFDIYGIVDKYIVYFDLLILFIFILSIIISWKMSHIDFAKKFGIKPDEKYISSNNHKAYVKYIKRIEMWNFISIICGCIMCVGFIIKTIKALYLFISAY